jgi:hypothetical protein
MAPPRTSVKKRLLERRRIEENGCWIYTGVIHHDGYGVIGSGRGKQFRAHRMSYQEFVGPIPHGMLVCHKCDVPTCINPDHLFLGTPRDNTRDAIAKGRMVRLRGEKHPGCKLSDADVVLIRQLRASGMWLRHIADRFGICFQYVSELSKGGVRGTTI